MTRAANVTGRVLPGITLTILMFGLAVTTFATDSKYQKKFDGLEDQATRVRGVALSILKQIKKIDAEYRTLDGHAIKTRTGEAQGQLTRVYRLRETYEATNEEILNGLTALESELKHAPTDEAELKPAITGLIAELTKYERAVSKYYDRSIRDFGQPSTGPMMVVEPSAGERFSISGEATAGLGSGSYKRPNATPSYEASTTDISFGIKGRYIPFDRTNVLFHLDRQSKIERREIAMINFGASGVRRFTANTSATAGFEVSKYSDKNNDILDYSTTGLFGRVDHVAGSSRFGGELRRDSRNYSNNDVLDYTTTTFLAHAILPQGSGSLRLNLKYQKRDNEDISFIPDHTEFHPSLLWKFPSGNRELGVSYQKISYPDVDDSPLDNTRIKAHLDMFTQDGTKSVRYGPAVMLYQFPNVDDGDFYDFKLRHHYSDHSRRSSSRQIDLAYRLHQDTTKFDFAQFSLRKESRPIGSGHYSRLHAAVRFYTETSWEAGRAVPAGTTDTVVFKVFSEPHTVDFQFGFGWLKTGSRWYRMLSIGPLVGAKFYIDPNGKDKTGEDADIDYNLMNPRNFVKGGIEVVLSGATAPGITWRGDASYNMLARYNAEPKTTTNYIKINGRTTYPVTPEWKIDGYMRLQSTKMSEKSSTDRERFEIGLQARYLFDIRR